MPPGWCLICGSAVRQQFAAGRSAPDLGRSAGPSDAAARFVLCGHCGHVYQDPMREAVDPAPFKDAPTAVEVANDQGIAPTTADDRAAGFSVADWLMDSVEPFVQHRSLLAIGPVAERAGLWNVGLVFRKRGWTVCQLSPAREWLNAASADPVSPPCPGRQFSLVLFPFLIERLPNPIPVLRALRSCVAPDGALFVATRNLLDPHPERFATDLLSVRHRRLYSPGALRTLLARSGFRPDAIRYLHDHVGVGVLARPAEWVPEQPHDDPAAIHQLFHALSGTGAATVLGWNLAALAETQPWVLPSLCQRVPVESYAIRRRAHRPSSVTVRTPDGFDLPVITWGDLDGHETGRPWRPLDLCEVPNHATFVQLGLGSGALAMHLAQQLRGSQHLFIWEADPALARKVLETVDLSPLWFSTQVSLLLEQYPEVPARLRERLLGPSLVYCTRSAQCWNTWAYREILGLLNPWGTHAHVPVYSKNAHAAVTAT